MKSIFVRELLCKSFTLIVIILLFSSRSAASPDCPIFTGRFEGLANGTTSDPSATGWYLDASNVAGATYFAVRSNRILAENLGGEGIWYSRTLSAAGYANFQVALKIHSEGDMNSSEYVKIYYRIDGGAEVLWDQRTGNFGTLDFISPELNGSTVQLIVKMYNYDNGGSQTSKYYVEEYRIFKENGPCSGGGSIQVTASATNSGVLTCTSPSLTLSASSAASGVTYSWSGPSGFSSSSQSVVVSTPGSYTVTGTNSSGSGSATVTVTSSSNVPDLVATGASLGCATSVSIGANSSVSGAQYSWTGPGNFSSTAQNPVVNAEGTYTVTVTNPSNGCTASQSVEVTAGSVASSDFWVENFSFSNGTTSDNGSTAWSIQNAGSGTFSVQNNEFMASFNSANEGVWLSSVVNISSVENVTVSANLKSSTASSNDYLESDDYIRVYYRLNGGSEVLIFGDNAGLNGVDNGTSSTSVTSTTLNGNTLQVIIRARNSHSTERYYFDNVKLTGTPAGESVTLSTSVNGTVTCTSTAQLSVTPSGGSVSSWSWTGPNGFSSSQQNPLVSQRGAIHRHCNATGGLSGIFIGDCTGKYCLTCPAGHRR